MGDFFEGHSEDNSLINRMSQLGGTVRGGKLYKSLVSSHIAFGRCSEEGMKTQCKVTKR